MSSSPTPENKVKKVDRPSKVKATPKPIGDEWVRRVISTYGDLLYDLCQSMLWSPADAPDAYRSIIRTLSRRPKSERFAKYERSWILQIAFRELRGMKKRSPRLLTPAEQVMLDSNPDPKARLRFFDSYFHRLPTESQLLLLLRDKYGLPVSEVASILQVPEASARLQRVQALRLMESWIYGGVLGTV